MTTATATMTVDEFAARYQDVSGYELVRGDVVEVMPGGFEHDRVVMNTSFLLESWARRTREGRVLTGEVGLLTHQGPDTVRGADVAYFSYRRMPVAETPRGFSRRPPDLVVEVSGLGQGWDALKEKAEEYLRMGVDRVWLVRPSHRTLHVFRNSQPPIELSENDELRDEELLPGFSCSVSDLFAP